MRHELIQQIRSAVREEVRGELMGYAPDRVSPPLPCDIPAEYGALRHAMNGVVPPGLLGCHFFVPAHQELWVSICSLLELRIERPVTSGMVALAMDRSSKMPADKAYALLKDIEAYGSMFDDVADVCASKVIECWRARRLIRWINDVELRLRTGKVSTEEATKELHRRTTVLLTAPNTSAGNATPQNRQPARSDSKT